MLNYDEISLLAFSSNDVVQAWKDRVIEIEQMRGHEPLITRHTNRAHENRYDKNTVHRDTYTRSPFEDRYTRKAGIDEYARTVNVYENEPIADVYTRVAHQSRYLREVHTDTYIQHGLTDDYRKQPHENRYSQQTHINRHTNVAERSEHTDKAPRDKHTNHRHEDTYTRRTGTYRYSRGYAAYSEYTRKNSYDRQIHADRTTRYKDGYYAGGAIRQNYTQGNRYGKGNGAIIGHYAQWWYYTQHTNTRARDRYSRADRYDVIFETKGGKPKELQNTHLPKSLQGSSATGEALSGSTPQGRIKKAIEQVYRLI